MNATLLTVAYPIFLQNRRHRAHTTNGRPPWFDILFWYLCQDIAALG